MSHSSPDTSARQITGRHLNMRQLEVFHAIMTTGTMSGAALALHVSQPALSRALAHCESRLGYPLFVRVGRRLQPTPEALRLHEEAREVYKGLDRLNTLAQRLGSAGVNTLNIVSSATFANSLIPLTLQQLARYSPDIRIDFRTATYDELPTYLLSEQAEIGISLTEAQHPGLKSQRIGQQRLVSVLPLNHPLAEQESIDPSELARSAWIGYPPDTPLGRICAAELHMEASSALIQVRSPAIALSFAQMGLGAAIVDMSCLTFSEAARCTAKPLSLQALSDIWVTTSARTPCSAVGQQFMDALRVTLQRLG